MPPVRTRRRSARRRSGRPPRGGSSVASSVRSLGRRGGCLCRAPRSSWPRRRRLLRLRRPDRDTVLYPAISYPTYAMGATLAGCRAVPVPVDDQWRIDLAAIDVMPTPDRAVCLWVNTPGNPTGGLDDLAAAAALGSGATTCPCSATSATPSSPGRGIPARSSRSGLDGVLAVHSLSKRSNLAGVRASAATPATRDLVDYLREVRKHAGLMVPGPAQAAAVVAWVRPVPTSRCSGPATSTGCESGRGCLAIRRP